MKDQLHDIDLAGLKGILSVPDSQTIDNSFFYVRRKFEQDDKSSSILDEPYHTAGYLAFFCISGQFELEVNLTTINVKKNSLVIVVPGSICHIRTSKKELRENNTTIMLMAASKEFLSTMRYDFKRLFKESVTMLEVPAITIKDENFEICRHYFRLTESLCRSVMPGKEEALKLLISSAFAYLGELWSKDITLARQNMIATRQNTRGQAIFDNFIQLVQEHHNQERGVSFYSEKLSLTPKYLSKLVKTISGKSAPEWIDAFMILEAKNMLKYSDKPIKEIVFMLNFPNQSVFYKFFKAHTGMTPRQYRDN